MFKYQIHILLIAFLYTALQVFCSSENITTIEKLLSDRTTVDDEQKMITLLKEDKVKLQKLYYSDPQNKFRYAQKNNNLLQYWHRNVKATKQRN